MANSLGFDCPFCSRTFPSSRGLGQHLKKAHPVERNEDLEFSYVKRRWDRDELVLLASHELRLRDAGCSDNLIKRLAEVMPECTFDAIKCTRARPIYAGILLELSSSVAASPSVVPCLDSGVDCSSRFMVDITVALTSLRDEILESPKMFDRHSEREL